MSESRPESYWPHLYWLTVLEEQKSYTRAAEKLGISKSAISQKISELERVTGKTLVHRTTRSVSLSDDGLRLVAELNEPFGQLRDIFTPGATGRLTVAGKYYCDAEVQRCPAISAANLWPTFSFQLYCPNPYWRSVSETSIRSLRSDCPSAIAPTSSACASSRIFSSSATPARTRRILC